MNLPDLEPTADPVVCAETGSRFSAAVSEGSCPQCLGRLLSPRYPARRSAGHTPRQVILAAGQCEPCDSSYSTWVSRSGASRGWVALVGMSGAPSTPIRLIDGSEQRIAIVPLSMAARSSTDRL